MSIAAMRNIEHICSMFTPFFSVGISSYAGEP